MEWAGAAWLSPACMRNARVDMETFAHRVLVIEDDPALGDLYTTALELAGCSASIKMDGQTGLRAALTDPPDLILLDLDLPGLNGLEVLSLLKADERTKSVPILMFSNHDEWGLAEHALQLGALAWLIKAKVAPAALVARVKSELAGPANEESRVRDSGVATAPTSLLDLRRMAAGGAHRKVIWRRTTQTQCPSLDIKLLVPEQHKALVAADLVLAAFETDIVTGICGGGNVFGYAESQQATRAYTNGWLAVAGRGNERTISMAGPSTWSLTL
jgi:DNA-binding response OmpR family regulator